MPYQIRRPPIRRKLLTAAVATAFVFGALPAVANACTVNNSGGSQVLKQLGDLSDYVLVPGATFESGAPGWTLNGAAVAASNESLHVNAAGDSHSLSISPTGTATSPPICVSSETPTFRFFARRTSGTWAQMNVNLLWTDSAGVSHTTTAGSIMGATAWAPTQSLSLGMSLPLWQPGSTLTVRLQFDPADFGGAWAIDDAYIDPYSR
jgi:hypothetical protein